MVKDDSDRIDLGLKMSAIATCGCRFLEVRVGFPQGEVLVTSVRDWFQGAWLVGGRVP